MISRKNRSKTFAWLRQANMICPGPSEIYPAPLLCLSKHARKFKKRKKRKKNGEKKRALRKTRIYNLRKGHAAKPKSRPIAAKRDGGGVGLPGTGSPRKTLAFERWMQQEIAAYQRLISSDGSRPKATARLVASFFTKPTVSLAQNPCRSNDKAQKSKACIRRWV